MYAFDLRTLYTSFVVMLVVCLAVVTLLWWQNRKRFRGLELIVLYIVLQFFGLVLIALRDKIPDFLSIIMANAFVVGGAFLALVGLEIFTDKKSSYLKHYLLLFFFLVLHVLFTYFYPSQELRNLNVGFVLMVVSAQSAYLMLFRTTGSMRRISKPMGYVFAFLVLVGLIRMLKFFFVGFSEEGYFHSGAFEVYVALMYQVAYFFLVFFLALMVNERLLNEISVQEEKFSKAFRYSPLGIMISTLNEGRIIEINEGYEHITGYLASEIVGKTTTQNNIWVDEADRFAFITELNEKGRVVNRTMQFRKANGELITTEFSSEIIHIDNEKCLLSVVNDITEKKKTEAELRKSQRILRSFASHLQNAGEEEKIVLATQIDNELNQSLAALKMDIGLLKQKFRKNDETGQSDELINKLDEVYKTLGNSLAFSLKLMTSLRNEVLYMMGLPDAIRLYVDEVNHKYPATQCFFDLGKVDKLPQQKQSTILYRIFEDAISNALLHSQASEIIVSLHGCNNSLELEISDNGVGFEYTEFMEHSSHGLMLMRERTSLLDGEMFVKSSPGEGSIVRIVVPLD